MTSGEHINTVVKKTRDVIILMTEEILAKKGDGNIDIVTDSRATDHCFTNINAFTEYKKFKISLVGKVTEKGIKFSITK